MPPSKRQSDKPKAVQGKSGRPTSKEAQRVPSRASTTSSKIKESPVISEGSLAILAREIGGEKVNGLVLCMYLNLPTTMIVNATNSASENGHLEANDTTKIETTQKLLLTWKSLRVGCKEREKVRELERALREMGKPEMADVVNDKHANQAELTSDAFSS